MKIKSLEICNFKLFDKNFNEISNISEVDLILLNGPNGYGKTTIFDAIEFALTGEIKRIYQYSDELGVKKNDAYNKKILIADETKEAYIKLCLEGNKGEIEIQRIYNPEKEKLNKVSKENNPYNIFKKFEMKLIVDGQEIKETEEVNRTLQEYHLNDMGDFFDKCCFLSQDEHLGFLKKANTDKVAALKFLFDIPSEQKDEEDRVDKLMKSLKNENRTKNLGYITKLENQKTKLNSEIESLNKHIKEATTNNEPKISYQRLFPEKTVYWDMESMTLDGEKYDEAIAEIEKLIYFSENQEACLNFLYNKPFKDIIEPFRGNENIIYTDNPLEYTYRYYPLVKDEEKLETTYFEQQKYNILKENINKRELQKINWNFISSKKLLDEGAINKIKVKLEQVSQLEKTQSIVSKVVTSITKTRTTLMNLVNDAVQQSIIDDKTCPLCGASYSEKYVLDQKIKAETDILQALCDNSSKEINVIIDSLYKEYFDALLKDIENKLKDTISEGIFNKLQEVKKNKSHMYNIKDLLLKLSINLPEKYTEDIIEIDKGYNDLIQIITKKLRTVPQEIEIQLNVKDFIHEYEKYYDKNEESFIKLTSEMLRTKINYVKSSFFNSSIKLLNEKKNELEKTLNRLEELNRIYTELSNYQDAIKKGIKEYKRKIIQDIEPLLYVYTAKILQQKFNGKSIYIKTDDDMENIQFINSVDDKQDILYNMSSGQLAAVSLSFLLCMNQVYSKQDLPILLIDDPIQTIDDVNMVGLVDILRHEFDDRQIFISTHEQKFEWYLAYKYKMTGREIKPFNMKNLLLLNDK
ncbi:AAA family ATPase [Ruminiclostridium herbifermentans]|uniref:Nuclease SbcCD subunit C n=1 Tax=Ruminiclostridium herbifermentans TaxID=2488810 RepID=A0A4U7JEZ4_9FIRM|nr:AAA family ATPase [Ruminiclostridium herbifermentans]QNU68090.1 AAA family ATPase [Ruminiclostridium herbifermentans]